MKEIKCPYCGKYFYIRESEKYFKTHCCPNSFCKKIIEVDNEIPKIS